MEALYTCVRGWLSVNVSRTTLTKSAYTCECTMINAYSRLCCSCQSWVCGRRAPHLVCWHWSRPSRCRWWPAVCHFGNWLQEAFGLHRETFYIINLSLCNLILFNLVSKRQTSALCLNLCIPKKCSNHLLTVKCTIKTDLRQLIWL